MLTVTDIAQFHSASTVLRQSVRKMGYFYWFISTEFSAALGPPKSKFVPHITSFQVEVDIDILGRLRL
jgi:hypothetical protein